VDLISTAAGSGKTSTGRGGTSAGRASRSSNRTTDDTRSRQVLIEVPSDVGHGDTVKGDAATVSTTVGVQVPHLDVALLSISQAGKLDGCSTLMGKVHCGLHHVARTATVIGARTVAMLDD